MPQTVGDRVTVDIGVPPNPLEILALVPESWNVLEGARLTYAGIGRTSGHVVFINHHPVWHRAPIMNALDLIKTGESTKWLEPPSYIDFSSHTGESFLREVTQHLIPGFVEREYRLRSFTARRMETSCAQLTEIAFLHMYEHGAPPPRYGEWTGKWTGFATCHKDKGVQELERFRRYFIERRTEC